MSVLTDRPHYWPLWCVELALSCVHRPTEGRLACLSAVHVGTTCLSCCFGSILLELAIGIEMFAWSAVAHLVPRGFCFDACKRIKPTVDRLAQLPPARFGALTFSKENTGAKQQSAAGGRFHPAGKLAWRGPHARSSRRESVGCSASREKVPASGAFAKG